ncbi:10850_t:CDS:2, partial [Entrophospora sp. SA101]
IKCSGTPPCGYCLKLDKPCVPGNPGKKRGPPPGHEVRRMVSYRPNDSSDGELLRTIQGSNPAGIYYNELAPILPLPIDCNSTRWSTFPTRPSSSLWTCLRTNDQANNITKPTIKKPTTKKPITKKPTTTTTKKSIMSKKSSKKEFNNGVSCNKSDSHNECALKFRSSPAITPSLYFAVTQQQGWETGGLRSEQPSRNTHPDMEDAYYVPYMANEKVHYPSDTPYTLFVLADGHGGSSASRHFCRMVPEAIQDVLCSQASWSFREPSGQQLFREKVKEMYKRLDNEYLSSQKKKFSEWLSNGCKDPMPSDQGSTLVIVILYDGVVINCNLGDSMALICKTLPLTTTGRIPLEIVYQSTIHSPGHPHKAYHIAEQKLAFNCR